MIWKNLRHAAKLLVDAGRVALRFDVLLEPGAVVKYVDSLRFGRHTTVQAGAYIYGSRQGHDVRFGDHSVVAAGAVVLGEGGVRVGAYTHLGPGVVVTSQYGDPASDPLVQNPSVKTEAVRIGSGCWIGSRSVIMPGTDLGDGCNVAPGSVVYGRWPAKTSLAGNPARRVGQRSTSMAMAANEAPSGVS